MENKPSRTEIHLYDALENLISELFADGPTRRGEDRAERCLSAFEKVLFAFGVKGWGV